MNARITSFRRGRHTVYSRQAIVEVEGVRDKKGADALKGKKLFWVSKPKKSENVKKKICGKITAAHGAKGLVRVVFERGLPGQCVGDNVEVTS